MRFCFYSPYFPGTLGGGEKQLLDIASVVSRDHAVYVAVPKSKAGQSAQDIKSQYEKFLGKSLDKLSFVSSPLGTQASSLKKLLWTRQYDVLFAATDGSLFFSLAKENHLHLQVPFTFSLSGAMNRLKLANWSKKNANSQFTRKVIENSWKTKVDTVLYPMVDVGSFKPKTRRSKIILSVGRFTQQLHAKRHDVLIEAFIKLRKKHPKTLKNWKLVLVGSVEDEVYLDGLKRQAKDHPVDFLPNARREELVDLYQSATIYWHAAGYDVDERKHPESVEHFGITTVEAMAGGSIPMVHGKGGQKEVLGDSLQLLSWDTVDVCVEQTHAMISDSAYMKDLRAQVRERAERFDSSVFEASVRALFSL